MSRLVLCASLALALFHTTTARADAPVADQAINCKPEGCISSGPGCDTTSVPGQCSFPRAKAEEMCRNHPQCVAVNCNTARQDCQARDTRKRDPWVGMTSIFVRKHSPLVKDQAINCKPEGCIASGPNCDTKAVPGQCSFPKAQAVELCFGHPQCVAVNCNSARNDCQARDWRKRDPWVGMGSIVLDKD